MTRRLRVLVDGRMLLGRFSGVARTVTCLVERLCENPDLQIVVLCGNELHSPWNGRDNIELLVSDFERRHRTAWARFWWEENKLPGWIARSGADVFHATWNHGIPAERAVPSVLTVHDIVPWSDSATDLSSWVTRAIYRHTIRSSLRRADRVAAVSGYSATQIAMQTGIDPAEIRVIYNGAEIPEPSNPGDMPGKPYVLYVGGHESRKNIESVFAAMDRYWRTRPKSLELRLTGRLEQLSGPARSAYERLACKDMVRFVGSPNDAELANLYNRATALLLLSRAEGFGLPVIEAMGHGCPVIASRCGALPEIVGDAGVLVDPESAEEVVRAMEWALDPDHAGELVKKGHHRAAAFTWEQAAAAYAREYRLAMKAACDSRLMHVCPTWSPGLPGLNC